jgi:uncharacterized protein with PIN domain
MILKETSEWFIGVKCPYCNKQLSLTDKHVFVWASERVAPQNYCVIAKCYYCNEEFELKFQFRG